MIAEAFQDLIPDNQCFGCGPANHLGLRIRSYWDEPGVATCTYRPLAHQSAGPEHFLNGGIIATLIDCHCVCTAVAHAYSEEQRVIGSDPKIWCVTGELSVRYLEPTPLSGEIDLRATIVETSGRKTRLACTVSSANRICAEGEVVALRVPPVWLGEKKG